MRRTSCLRVCVSLSQSPRDQFWPSDPTPALRDRLEIESRRPPAEYLYKEAFKGLDADSALQVGESVKLGGEVVDSCFEAPKKAPPKKGLSQTPFFLEKKMQAEE